MAIQPFFDEALGQEILEVTDGAVVEYHGQTAFMHCERPTIETFEAFAQRVQGLSRVLIGATSCFPDITRGDLITVDGDDYVIGDFGHPGDGEEIIIALTTSTRK